MNFQQSVKPIIRSTTKASIAQTFNLGCLFLNYLRKKLREEQHMLRVSVNCQQFLRLLVIKKYKYKRSYSNEEQILSPYIASSYTSLIFVVAN